MLGLGVFFTIPAVSSQQADGDPVRKMVGRMTSLGSFQAQVSISGSETGIVRGSLFYQRGKIHFSMSGGRVIAGDGRSLTVYNPASRVAGKQDTYGGGGGLGWLLNGFTSRVSGNRAHLTADDPSRYINQVRVTWDPRTYIMRSISIQYRSGSTTTISFSRIARVKNISQSKFSWHPPAGSRTVENPLNQRN